MAINGFNATTKSPVNPYTIRPKNLVQYTAFNGVTDFSQIGQFTMYEKGYQMLAVIEMPRFMTMLAENDDSAALLVNNFRHILETEFKGLDGLPDTTGDTGITISDGINEQNMVGKVSRDTSITVSSSFYEKVGSPITKFCEYYLTGIKDPMTQARTYHGLIKYGAIEPSYENEVFTMLYVATDSTMLRVEKAWLLCNCQLTKAETSIYTGNRSDIGGVTEVALEWTAFPITGYEVDKAAKRLLQNRTGVEYSYNSSSKTNNFNVITETDVLSLDSYDHKYGIFDEESGAANQTLIDLANQTSTKKFLHEASSKEFAR
jgi:hypothetical protein